MIRKWKLKDENYISSESIIINNTPLNNVGVVIDDINGSTGNYLKFSNGTLIQYGDVSISVINDRHQGGLTYYSGSNIIEMPISFVNNNYVVFTNIVMANMNYFAQSYAAVVSKSSVQISFASTGSNETRTIQWLAIGVWK